ncbi:hypothetical protein [Photobacterium halotolerans]|uniref:hypothetical protein n=1 Tax=Photobacterium halotolerans TaxID=265726 RepID=UPI0013737708|nr:hypothetical protein [Photobacterium halotolerans]NAW88786.1 hypothetical protein [Photobacterium halotolerans]
MADEMKITKNTDDSVICNLKVWHKPFGWFWTIGFAIFLPVTSLHPLQAALGVLGLWSVLRKREIHWCANEAQWVYRTRNFWKWREVQYDMTASDTLTLIWSRTESDSSHFNLRFIPKSAQFLQRHRIMEHFTIEIFPTQTGEVELTATMKKISHIYRSCNISLNTGVELDELNDKTSKAIHDELGIDFLPTQSDEKDVLFSDIIRREKQ